MLWLHWMISHRCCRRHWCHDRHDHVGVLVHDHDNDSDTTTTTIQPIPPPLVNFGLDAVTQPAFCDNVRVRAAEGLWLTEQRP